jgi:hypothetical protein
MWPRITSRTRSFEAPGAHLLLLDRADLVAMDDRPRAVNDAVLAFLAGDKVDPLPC